MTYKGQTFYAVLEVRKYKIKVLADLVSHEDPWPSIAMSSYGRRGKGAICGLFNKDIGCIHEGCSLST